MKKIHDIRNVMKLSFVFIGGVIGAGFASGKELYEFFIVYGDKWTLGLMLCGVIFSVCIFGIIKISNSNSSIQDYGSFMRFTMGDRMGRIMEMLSGSFLFVMFFAMISASGSLAEEGFSLGYSVGVTIMLGFCLWIFIKGEKGIIWLNSVLAPVLIFGCIFLGINTLLKMDALPAFSLIGGTWFFSALIYSSYNIITVIPVMIPLRRLADTDKKAVLCGIMGGFGIFVIGLAIGFVLWFFPGEVCGNIPVLTALSEHGLVLIIYKIVLVSAIFTTAAANGFGAVSWLREKIKCSSYGLYLIIIALGAIFSRVSFSNFIKIIYPIFGYWGICQIIIIFFVTFMKANINCK